MRLLPAIVVLVASTAVTLGATPAVADELSGVVLDAATGLGISGALIAADDASTESAADGSFALSGVSANRVAVFVFAEGYTAAEAELVARVPRRIVLRRNDDAVEIIEVSGKAPDNASPSAYTFSREQIRALPGSANDVLRALQSLPGVRRMSYGLGGLVLRGASAHESAVYLDGIEVPLAYHFGGITSFYPSTLLGEVVLTPGGGDAVWGRSVGGVAELRSRKARVDRYRVGGELGVFDASVYGESALAGGGVALGLRRSYADAFLGELLPDDRMVLPRYYDGQLRWDRDAGGGTLTVLGFFSDDRIVGWGGTDYRQGFARTAVRWERAFGPTTLSVMPWAGWGRTELKYVLEHTEDRPDLPQTLRLDRHPVGMRSELRRDTRWGHVAGGVDVQGAYVRLEQASDLLNGSIEPVVDDGTYLDTGAWAEARWRIEDGKLSVKPGLRVDYLGVPRAYVIEPRIVTTHELTPWLTLRESFGIHNQPPGPVAAVGTSEGRGNVINPIDPRGKLVRGVHTSIGARVELPAAIIASVTAYHVQRRSTRGKGPVETQFNSDATQGWGLPFETGLGIMFDNAIGEEFNGLSTGKRRSVGAELSLQRRSERVLAWLSYTIARSEYRTIRLGNGLWRTDDLDQTHTLNAVASVRVGAWRLGARLRYATGLPYTPVVTTEENPLEFGKTNSARLPAFTSVDLRADRAWRRGWGTLSVFLDVQNVTNHSNPEGIDYIDDDLSKPTYQPGLPVLPMIGVSFEPP